jgi:caffeoyl-CoA O-methyltransferase
MDFIDSSIQAYSEAHSSPESSLLQKINRETYASVMAPRMLSGHLQGRFLAMISKMVQPSNILEIGTYTGYSALCLAEGLKPGGKLVTIDINEELEGRVRSYINKAGHDTSIEYHVGDAATIIPRLDLFFNLVWIDADKLNYSNYFDLVIDKVEPGGFILADNVLWSGKVLDPAPDKDAAAIQAFNRKVMGDARVENVLLPLRDGIMVMRKI